MKIILFILLTIALLSCKKEEEGVPICIQNLIDQEIENRNELKVVYQYEYENEIVYEFIRCPSTLNSRNICPDSSVGFFFL